MGEKCWFGLFPTDRFPLTIYTLAAVDGLLPGIGVGDKEGKKYLRARREVFFNTTDGPRDAATNTYTIGAQEAGAVKRHLAKQMFRYQQPNLSYCTGDAQP